ncbi:NECAP endocytosis associated 1 [Phyllostomus discolor]|uniref:Adaptin ear-binding coat-associated protein 1 n=1 Tax=Phyllostomus discolor TaxID=89673 RepID=A0A834EKI1_9CHIR|nr:NECAP endocytosis associated 1 [Phyllostomus discolor]
MAAELEYESVLCVKPDVSVYRIPPRASNRGYRASDWKLDQPDWTGRLRITSKGKIAYIKLEDKVSGNLCCTTPAPAPVSTSNDLWGDFSTAPSSVPNQAPQPSNWVQF